MRVLVTGAAGMLGHALRESCPAEVTMIGLDLPELDITDPASVERAIVGHHPDALLNGAAYTDVDGCESHEPEALAVNGAGAGVVASACRSAGIPVLHVSTDYVFDGKIPAPGAYAEEDATGPLSAYGRTKLAGEQALASSCPEHWIVRTQWLYGLSGKNFVETMLRLAADRDSLAVVDDQVGCPTSTHDLAPVLWSILLRRPPHGIYHASSAGSCSWHEFAAEIFRQAEVTIKLDRMDSAALDRPAPRPARGVLGGAKLAAALGAEMPSWQESLRRYLAKRETAGAST
jgi:dTDP-4-dehydrorhamnose reductase